MSGCLLLLVPLCRGHLLPKSKSFDHHQAKASEDFNASCGTFLYIIDPSNVIEDITGSSRGVW
jgi:hypothetical protein